ncbi:MAG: hypothetical protein H0X49_06375 [Acidobacteria bacterium]|nr:hypothetical protein [Acidobacteriota bacterium]
MLNKGGKRRTADQTQVARLWTNVGAPTKKSNLFSPQSNPGNTGKTGSEDGKINK